MKKRNKIISFMLTLFFVLGIFANVVKAAPNKKEEGSPKETGINVDASSALLMEPKSGKIIFEKNSNEKLPPASVTKIMTMLLSMEAVDSGRIKLTDKVTISENSKKMGGSSMLLDTGEVRTVEDLIKGIGIASGNDAAVAMAEYLAGSEDAFVKLMNERASQLGMKNTSFKNCTGLSAAGHVTTAYDISLMSRELLKHPTILKYTGTYMETISEGRKSPIGLVNHNKLVRFFKGCDGLKTGFTDEAKYCISATATRDGIRMLTVIMGSPTYKVRNKDASMLLNYGFSKFECKKILTKGSDVEKVTLNKNGDRFFVAKAKEDLNIITEKGKDAKITKKIVLDEAKKEYKINEVVGNCEVYQNGELVGKVKIYSDRNVKRPGVFENLKNNFVKILDRGV
ncbi:D-alanyl-D-alanine carboxypeptidase family protein [Clostridium thailandense]|uniref:D-alanyl-D-alanine carboxypeptidase n=1 Tax=Clostridium thailandense TaxID=2794346 RepID=A0A949U3H0_9CLOT|nr:D-alanyl-D-alanine carboxypeptidase family protein [Clostridium thailandense]MBV7276775.1 D-alanyl-D-alanine carboxypeptidase [Clostridium thailandense]MCH5136595.1 D-alanyl-D-alanine carboxypeptidase [Clostridiaceae bacterium UIB06]